MATRVIKSKNNSVFADELDGSFITAQNLGRNVTYLSLTDKVDGMTEADLINKYRDTAKQSEVAEAINHIISEAISADSDFPVSVSFVEGSEWSSKIQKRINEEFRNIQKVMGFKDFASEHFSRWYVDGRIFYNIQLAENAAKDGIEKVVTIDPRTMKKIKEVKESITPAGVAKQETVREYYVYFAQQMGMNQNNRFMYQRLSQPIEIKLDDIAYSNSGLYDDDSGIALSYLHRALRPANQLRMIEDSLVVMRVSRAPSRRAFYIDVGGMTPKKAEEYMERVIAKFKNNLTYDSKSGEFKENRHQMAMLEDFWFPQSGDGKGTKVETIQGDQSLVGDLPDLQHFKNKLYQALNVPRSRFDQSQQGMVQFGRSTETTRDELIFQKFISTLQKKFEFVFYKLLQVQLTVKRVVTPNEWLELKKDLAFDWTKDNIFEESKFSEIMAQRIQNLQLIEPYIGRYFSNRWVYENVLRLGEEEMKAMQEEIKKENKEMAEYPLSAPNPNLGFSGNMPNINQKMDAEGNQIPFVPKLDNLDQNDKEE